MRGAPALGAGLVMILALTAISGGAQTRSVSPVLRRDSIARVARDRTVSVVFLHTITLGSPEEAGGGNRAQGQRPNTRAQIFEGLGSGVVIDASGSILTNAHVIEGTNVIHVLTSDGNSAEATVIGTDPDTDLALLRASGLSGLTPARLGNSDRVNVGDWVVAIGSPFGLHHTVTTGIISAKARGVDDSGIEYLQTDTAINPGNSGGALFDLDGALIGITTAVVSKAGENIGLNFVIPINAVKEVLPQLRTGTIIHGWIGITTVSLSPLRARALGVDSALQVVTVTAESPAARAGIRPGDMVLAIEGPPPVTAPNVRQRIRQSVPGTSLLLQIRRDKERLDIRVEVSSRPRLQ